MLQSLLTFFAWLSVCGFVNAAISMDPTIICQDLDLDGVTQQVCATNIFETPSPVQNSDGTTSYEGQYSYRFAFWEGLENGTDTTTVGAEQAVTTLSVIVSWVPDDRSCQVLISGEACLQCSLCEETNDPATTTLSADCSNLSGGRVVECERAFIYYPLVANAAIVEPNTISGGDNSEGDGETESEDSAAFQVLHGFASLVLSGLVLSAALILD